MIKLNVGCGPDIKPVDKGWVNIDGNFNEGVNLVLDLGNQVLPFPPNTVDHILAQNIIEHISRHKQRQFIQQLYDRLKIGGTITIEMPNLRCIAERYLGIRTDGEEDLSTFDTAAFIFGAQEDDFGCHRWIYDELSLEKLLTEIGFVVYYIDEIRGTNLICKAIKPLIFNTIENAFQDCAYSSLPYYIIRSVGVKDAFVLAVRLSDFGRVFCCGDFPEFEDENIITMSVNPTFAMTMSVKAYFDTDKDMVNSLSETNIDAFLIDDQFAVDEVIEWITKQD